MEIKIIVVGNVKEHYYQNKIEEFLKQIQKRCPVRLICIKDESIPKQAGEASMRKVKDTEGEKILEQIVKTDYVVALCIDGKKLSNEKMCMYKEKADRIGKTSVTYIIGGSLGLSDAVRKRADEKMSFSDMTFPHQLMRVMLLEVLANTICDM
ncbi:MAG: 23S rRNA (pseudouridine(1915)-N(3))-methyltransferase RlmH [Wujia sp.]